jgi:hypothetical protein
MRARVDVLTLGVSDLERALEFYGWADLVHSGYFRDLDGHLREVIRNPRAPAS